MTEVDLFRVRSLPFLARRNYLLEIRHILFWSVLAGLLEGQFAAVVVAKSFQGGDNLIAVAAAMPTAAYLLSLTWGMLSVGRRKVPLAMLFVGGTALCAGAVGAIPASPRGAVWFVVQVAAAQVLLAGVITVRSAIWKSNYPREIRGRITARLRAVRFVMGVATSLVSGWLGDIHPSSYRLIYPAAALSGAFSMWMLSRIRIRGERGALRANPANRGRAERDVGPPILEPHNLAAILAPGHVLGHMFRILKADTRFRRYCVAQMFTGIANLMTVSIVVAVVTRDLVPESEDGYWISMVLLDALPKLVMLGSLRRWGSVFDRLGVLGMRTINLLCWTASIVFAMFGDLLTPHGGTAAPSTFVLAIVCFTLRAFANGLGQGGGALAWHIGHLHFARPEEAEVYMGIHVSLTGIRGLIAPLAGMWLWRLFGWPVWLIAVACSIYSFRLFSALAREEQSTNASSQEEKLEPVMDGGGGAVGND
jgi:hypothetical protein